MKTLMFLVVMIIGCDSRYPGAMGESGIQGPIGPQGMAGIQGPKGPPGVTGAMGLTGIQGPQGLQGIPGPQGLQGLQGSTGLQGSSGAVGPIGPQGPQGIPGQRGIDGQVGPAGAQGPQGIPGMAGGNVYVIDNNNQRLGHPVPWRNSVGQGETAVLMDTINPSPEFPQGYVMPERPSSDIFFVGQDCTGTPMVKPWAPLFENLLYWLPGTPITYLKVGSVHTAAGSIRSSGADCSNVIVQPQTFLKLEDSGFRIQLENTKPWTLVFE